MESTLTAFYTPPVVIKAMYGVLDRLGYEKGNMLEPSCGTGNFFGLIPEKMAGSKLYGVELDDLTGRIAKQLYQKATIAVQGFEIPNCQTIILMWCLAMYLLEIFGSTTAATNSRNSLSTTISLQKPLIK